MRIIVIILCFVAHTLTGQSVDYFEGFSYTVFGSHNDTVITSVVSSADSASAMVITLENDVRVWTPTFGYTFTTFSPQRFPKDRLQYYAFRDSKVEYCDFITVSLAEDNESRTFFVVKIERDFGTTLVPISYTVYWFGPEGLTPFLQAFRP